MQNQMGKYYELIRSYQMMANETEPVKIKEEEIPNELLLLLEAFKNVKTLEISIQEATHESIITYLLILLNIEWLFPCVLDLNLDFSCYKLNQEVMNSYKKNLMNFMEIF